MGIRRGGACHGGHKFVALVVSLMTALFWAKQKSNYNVGCPPEQRCHAIGSSLKKIEVPFI